VCKSKGGIGALSTRYCDSMFMHMELWTGEMRRVAGAEPATGPPPIYAVAESTNRIVVPLTLGVTLTRDYVSSRIYMLTSCLT
jgi:hypothetical protein